ncbi:hypothetical protein [Paraburkholderia sp. D1E]|uniref:hypothetical protein n=1 Tax=Paraburkholderia sp. D1E TaxID=3461398 RepID=UPI00404535E2
MAGAMQQQLNSWFIFKQTIALIVRKIGDASREAFLQPGWRIGLGHSLEARQKTVKRRRP